MRAMALDWMAAALRSWLLALVFWPLGAHAALSVMPHHTDGIVMQLRSSILLDEKDLIGPFPSKECSSLDDGPFCEGFSEFGQIRAKREMTPRGEVEGESVFLAAGDQHESAQFVVDGVLSHRVQNRNKEAFDWSLETFKTFSSYVSRVGGDTLAGQNAATFGSNSEHQKPASARSGAQCFRLAFNRLPLGVFQPYVPANFSVGLPSSLAASWEGLWEPVHRSRGVSRETLPWRTQLALRTSLGYLRFQQPVVLRRLLVAVRAGDISAARWGEDALICGRLTSASQEKKQSTKKWCVNLDQVAATALEEYTDRYGAPDPEDFIDFDVGNSVHAIDEVAILAAPPDSIHVALVEVMATPPSHPRHSTATYRKVVLLRRPTSSESEQVEPVLTTVARDAVLWDLNEVLKHQMKLRNRSRGSKASKASGSRKQQPTSKAQGLGSFQEMLRELKAGLLDLPRGVSLARLKKEVVTLVAAAKEIQDEDVLRHSKIESLLQQRLQEKRLDGLMALQALWRQRGPVAQSSADDDMTRSADQAAEEIDVSATETPASTPRPKPKPGTARRKALEKMKQGLAQALLSKHGLDKESEASDSSGQQEAVAGLLERLQGLSPSDIAEKLKTYGLASDVRDEDSAPASTEEYLETLLGSIPPELKKLMEPVLKKDKGKKVSAFEIGQKVQRRDGGTGPWREGFVTSVDPLKVTVGIRDPEARGYKWDEVRRIPEEEDVDAMRKDIEASSQSILDELLAGSFGEGPSEREPSDEEKLAGEEWADAAAEALSEASDGLAFKTKEFQKKQKNMFDAIGGKDSMAFEMNVEGGKLEFKVVQGDSMLKALAKQLGKAKNGASESTEQDVEKEASEDGEEASSTVDQLKAKLTSQLAAMAQNAAADSSASVSGEEAVQVDAESVRAVTSALHENIQEVFQQALRSQGLEDGGDADDESSETNKKKNVKMQVHVLNMDENGQIDPGQGGLAKMIQSMMSAQNDQDPVTLTGFETNDDSATEALQKSLDMSNVAEAMQAMLGQATQLEQRARSQGDTGDDGPAPGDEIVSL